MIRRRGIEQSHHECPYDNNYIEQYSDEDHARQTEEDTKQPFNKHCWISLNLSELELYVPPRG